MSPTDTHDVSAIWQEIAARRQRGEPADVEEYARRYPQHAAALRQRDGVERLLNTRPWPATLPSTTPHSFGQFRVLRQLGAGSFGTVWLCQDDRLGRQVALKVLHPQHSASADHSRFLTEARSVAALDDHPNIVKVLSAGEAEGKPYIVYQYIPGSVPLADRLQKGPLPPLQAAALIAQLASALGHCHRQGVFHRDVKPGNILLDERGKPLLIDFGLAIHEEGLGQELGCRAGTLLYMSPEQLQGHYIDGRADIYSLGMVLYQALTGRLPFSGKDVAELTHQALHREAPSPREKSPDVPRELADICLRAIRKRPEDRYSDASAFEEDLRAWARASVANLSHPRAIPVASPVPPTEAPVPAPRRQPSPLLLLGLLAGAVPCLLLGAWLLYRAVRPVSPPAGAIVQKEQSGPSETSLKLIKEGPDARPPEPGPAGPGPVVVPGPEKKKPPVGGVLIQRGGEGFAPPGGSFSTTGIAWDGTHLWVAKLSGHVFQLTPEGKLVRLYSPAGSAPHGMAWVDGRLWVASSLVNGRIVQYRLHEDKLEMVSWFPAPLPLRGGARIINGLAWDGKALWRAHDHSLTPFDRSGKKAREALMPEPITAVTWDGQHFWVAENPTFHQRARGLAKLHVLDKTGKTLKTYGTPLKAITGLAWADERHLWAVSAPFGGAEEICPLDVSAARRDLLK